MEKLVLTIMIEANKEDINEIKGKIIEVSSEAMTSCNIETYNQYKARLHLMSNSIYGAFPEKHLQQKEIKTDMFFERLDKTDPYEIGIIN